MPSYSDVFCANGAEAFAEAPCPMALPAPLVKA